MAGVNYIKINGPRRLDLGIGRLCEEAAGSPIARARWLTHTIVQYNGRDCCVSMASGVVNQ